jgi:CO/xanthine dehydrogenase Mo-binding subunit
MGSRGSGRGPADTEEIAEDALRLIDVEYAVREEVAEKLELPEHHVRVIKQHMGGGFGSKQIAWKHTVIAALLSRRTGLAVQLMLDHEAENLAAGNRNATRQRQRRRGDGHAGHRRR